MYIPEYFKNENFSDIIEFIDANGFAILVSEIDGRPWATHIPVLLDKNPDNKYILTGHISKANKQGEGFFGNSEVLVIFSGPDAYISSSWYDHENVPTWNYKVIHVYGRIHIIDDDLLKRQLSKLVDKYESGTGNPVSVDNMSEDMLGRLMKGIVGFEIEITEIQASSKLSQNRDRKNHERIINELEKRGDLSSAEIARLMKKI